MPVRRNSLYSDPQLNAALNSLSSLFAAPSGSDLAGYANARVLNDKAKRLDDVYNYSKRADYDRAMAERMAIGAGVYNPNQSFYAVDKSADTQRYGYDTQAQTSRMNNLVDNQAKVVTNAYQPLNPGQIRPEIPQDMAAAFGLAPIPQTKGIDKPLTESEQLARERQQLKDAGMLTDEMMLDAIVGAKTPVSGVDPKTGKPRIMSPGEAVRTGASPYAEPKGDVLNYVAPDGKAGTARMGPDGNLIDTQNNVPLPQGSKTYKATAQGTPEQMGGKLTEVQGKYALFSSRGEQASKKMDESLLTKEGKATPYLQSMMDAGFDANLDYVMGSQAAETPMGALLQNLSTTPQGRAYYQSALDMLAGILRIDTGAAVTNKEFSTYGRIFVPMPGDDAATVARKLRSRDTALTAMKALSNGGAASIEKLLADNNVPIPERLRPELEAAKQGATAGAQQPAPQGDWIEASPGVRIREIK